MPSKKAFPLLVVLIGFACHSLSADDRQDGKRILVKESGALFVMDSDGMNRRKIAENVRAAALSRDGNLVSYADNKGVYVFSLLDSQPITLARLTEGHVDSLAWSPDQKVLAYDVEVRMKSWNLFLASYPPSGDAPRNLGHWYETMSFAPNGKSIVHPSFDPTDRDFLQTINVETGKRETIYKATAPIWDAKYAPDGSSIAFMMTKAELGDNDDEPDSGGSEIDLWILPLDSKNPVKIMDGVFAFDWSADGHFLAIDTGTRDGGYPPGDGAVFISSVDGKVQFQLSKDAPSIGAKFSPDSKKVMFVDYNASHLLIGDLTTRKLTPLPPSGSRGYGYVVYDWK
jgi:Tol biopolymer transport system component